MSHRTHPTLSDPKAGHPRRQRHAASDYTLRAETLAIISHELRTPLTAILGFGELLDASPDAERDVRHFANGIRTAGQALREVVDDLILLGKLSVSRPDVAIEAVPLRAFWSAVAARCAPLARPDVPVRWQEVVPDVVVDTDPTKLARVLWHVVANAVKFTEHGAIDVTADAREHGVSVTVCDTGIGMRSEHCEHVFEPFWQADSSLVRTHGGLGLGLYLARRALAHLGGTIEVASRLGHGSTFRLTIPSAKRGASAWAGARTLTQGSDLRAQSARPSEASRGMSRRGFAAAAKGERSPL